MRLAQAHSPLDKVIDLISTLLFTIAKETGEKGAKRKSTKPCKYLCVDVCICIPFGDMIR